MFSLLTLSLSLSSGPLALFQPSLFLSRLCVFSWKKLFSFSLSYTCASFALWTLSRSLTSPHISQTNPLLSLSFNFLSVSHFFLSPLSAPALSFLHLNSFNSFNSLTRPCYHLPSLSLYSNSLTCLCLISGVFLFNSLSLLVTSPPSHSLFSSLSVSYICSHILLSSLSPSISFTFLSFISLARQLTIRGFLYEIFLGPAPGFSLILVLSSHVLFVTILLS